MMFGQKMQYMSESMFMLNFPNVSVAVKNVIMRMMSFMGSSCFCSTKSSRLKNGACFEVGGWWGGGAGVGTPLIGLYRSGMGC